MYNSNTSNDAEALRPLPILWLDEPFNSMKLDENSHISFM